MREELERSSIGPTHRGTGFDSLLAHFGAVAQSGEHLVCTQAVVGSMPTGSTRNAPAARWSSTPPVRERPRFDSWQGHTFP